MALQLTMALPYSTAQMQCLYRFVHVHVHVGLHIHVGILSHYMWLSAHVYHQVINKVHMLQYVSPLVHTYIVWYMYAGCDQVNTCF